MAGSLFGTLFRITTWGESHGKAIGVVVDGCPAGLSLHEDDIQAFLDRRRPGQNRYTTARSEADRVQILSGVFEGRTTGTPISMIVENTDQRSRDYSNIMDTFRPGHADHCFDKKYGFRDYRGGGRSSARETIGRVAAGAIAAKVLEDLGVHLTSWVSSIGPVSCDPGRFDRERILQSPLYMPDAEAESAAAAYLEECLSRSDSSGGCIACCADGVLPGIGEPVFDKLDAELGKALFSIGAVKAVEIGDGVSVSSAKGSENNDQYELSADAQGAAGTPGPHKSSNHAGGVYGGIADGSRLFVKVHFKPTPSIAMPQQALSSDGNVRTLTITGRHDPVIVPRAVVVVESMVAVTLLDLTLRNMTATMDGVHRFYKT